MLSELLHLLEKNNEEYTLYELGRILGVQPSAIDGMLQTLVRKGRVVELGADCGICESCAIRGHCNIPVTRARRYKISIN